MLVPWVIKGLTALGLTMGGIELYEFSNAARETAEQNKRAADALRALVDSGKNGAVCEADYGLELKKANGMYRDLLIDAAELGQSTQGIIYGPPLPLHMPKR